MNPVAANITSAAILEGYRRAMSEYIPPDGRLSSERDLTTIVERATERAQALPPRLPGTGERLDRSA